VQRRQLTVTMTSEVFLAQFAHGPLRCGTSPPAALAPVPVLLRRRCRCGNGRWVIYNAPPTPAAAALSRSAPGRDLPLADALCWLVASRAQILDVLELEKRGPTIPSQPKALKAPSSFSATSVYASSAGRRRGLPHLRRAGLRLQLPPLLDEEEHRTCFLASELEELEGTMSGISAMAFDVLGADGTHPQKAGPCAGCAGSADFLRMQNR